MGETVWCPVAYWAHVAPWRPLFITPEATLTAGQLEQRVRLACRALRDAGVAPGQRIGLWLDDPVTLVVALLALWRLQAVAGLLSTRVPAGGLPPLLQQAGILAVVTDREGSLPVPCWAATGLQEGEAEGAEAMPRLPLRQPATVFFTSGSTGRPKGVLHSLGNHVYSARGAQANMPLGPEDRWLLILPLYHVGGMGVVVRCLLAGATVVVPAPQEPVAQALERYRITHVSMVHTQLWRALRQGNGTPPASLRAVLLGGSAIPEALRQEAYLRGWPLHTSYGLTETASQVTTTPPGASLDVLRTSGRLLPYRELRLGAQGELLVRGAVRCLGYLEEGQLVSPFDAQGWLDTGDLGYLDAQGWLHVTGRRDNRFVSGGENIQPEAIEAALLRLPGLAQAVVVPVPDEEFGQRPAAFVQLAPEARWEPLGWGAQLRQELPGFMIPVAFWPWPPDAPQGMKVSRPWLRARAQRLWQEARPCRGGTF